MAYLEEKTGMDNIEQTLQNLTRVVEGLTAQINSLSIQVATITTSLDHSTSEIRRCLDHHDERIADHEARIRSTEQHAPWMDEIEKIQAQLEGLYVSINSLEKDRDKSIGGKEYLAYLIGLAGALFGIYAVFFK